MTAPYTTTTATPPIPRIELLQQEAQTTPRPPGFWAEKAFEKPEPLEFVVEELIVKHTLNFLMAPPGHKKTYVVTDIAVSTSTGENFLDFPTKQMTVLFIDEESGQRTILRRLYETMRGRLIKQENAPPIFCVSMAGINVRQIGEDVPEGIVKIKQYIQETGAELVIIDSFAAITAGADENSVQQMQPVMMNLRRLIETTGVTIICTHHANKTTGKYRGSTAIEGGLDLLLAMDSPQGSKYITFNTDKTRHIAPKSFTALACWQPETEQFYLSPTEVNVKAHVSRLEACVLRYVSEHPNATTNDIIDACETSRNYVQTLARDGKLERTNKGVSGKVQAEYAIAQKGLDIVKSTGEE
jgi:hypothetical protein